MNFPGRDTEEEKMGEVLLAAELGGFIMSRERVTARESALPAACMLAWAEEKNRKRLGDSR